MSAITPEVHLEVETFLFQEARILEELRFRDWLALLTEDIRYSMPVRRTVQPRPPNVPEEPGEVLSLFNDTKSTLLARVERLETGIAHAEVPPSVTQRLICNVLIEPGTAEPHLIVHSRFIVYQVRRQHSFTFFGKRRDQLRRESGGLRLAERRIELAHTILPSTVSIFF